MAQQTLQTVIALSGKVDNTFGNIGEALINVGNHIDALSQKIIDFGKESTKEYVEYDDVMREVQALGEYDDKTMRILNEYNKTIAQTSKYTMDQAAQAEVMMAQLGLNMEQTKTLMPTVMNLATAANIDLADSLDYLYYTLNALGMPMEYANTLSDQMSKTAAISAADINTLGQSMQRLGSGAQFFAGGSSEILAILGGISQFGSDMQGTNAGTQLRNFMLTLLAPTQSKDKLIQSLRVTEDEWAAFESYMEDAEIDIDNTADAMNELGLSVYDSTTGELKPAIQIIGELKAALATLSEAERNKMLGSLFGKRTTTTALNLMEALGTIIDYQQQIKGGSAGYTESMADTMEGGLGGALREFTASWDAFQTTIGETIAPSVEGVADFMTDIVNGLTDMDKEKLELLVSTASTIAVAGPALKLAGGAFRLIGYAMTPIGAAAIGLTALAAAATALYQLGESKFAANFGEMELDTETLLAHVNGIGDAFSNTYTDVTNYNTALETAVSNFETASTTLSGDLLTNMITGATLTPEQIKSISSLGETMGNELLAGISASFDKSASYLTMLFGGLDNAAHDEEYAGAILLAKDLYDSLVGQAEQLGREFGETLGAAMDDGIITGNEYSAIMEKMQAYNDAMAFAEQADQAAALAQQLHKAESVSWDSAEAFLKEQAEIMNANIAEAEMTHIGERAKWEVYYDEAIKEGWINPTTGKPYGTLDENGVSDRDKFFADMDKLYTAKIQGYKDDNAQITMAVFKALVGQSDFGKALPLLTTVLGNMDAMDRDSVGSLTLDDVDWASLDAAGLLPEGIAGQLFAMHNASGRFEKLFKPYSDTPEVAKLLEQMGYVYALGQEAEFYQWRKDDFNESGGTIDPRGEFASPEQLAYNQRVAELEASISAETAALMELRDTDAELSAEIAERENRLAGNDRPWHYYLTGGEGDDYAALYGTNVVGGNLTQRKESVTLDITEAETRIAELQQELDALTANGQTIPVVIEPTWNGTRQPQTLTGYADGGRATVPSIFGEAGAEWAIPEEHTSRVASLLNAARAASGFTWPELIARNGGLNAGGAAAAQLIYSPTIIANDSAGVEQKLIEDKERLDRWWREKQMHDEVEVYA